MMSEVDQLDASEKRLRRFVKLIVIGVIAGAATMAFFYVNQSFSHKDAQTISAQEACRAIHKTKRALLRIEAHAEEKSLENVRAGVTSVTTSVEEVKRFYASAIGEIRDITCVNKSGNERAHK